MNRIKNRWKIAYGILGLTAILLIWRSFFGINFSDEPFYFALAKRFAQGDGLLVDEWFPTQLIGALLVPFYRIYIAIVGSVDGIILTARILYVISSGLIAVYMLYVMKKQEESCGYSILVTLAFMLYVRAGMGTFSYYSVGLESFVLFIFLIRHGKILENGKFFYILAGISFSISVLCMPHMVLLFVVLLLAYICRRRESFLEKNIGSFLLGILMSAAIFLLVYGSQILNGLENIPYILADPEHQETAWMNVTETVKYMCFTYLKFTWPLYLLTMIGGVMLKKKGKILRKWTGVYSIIVYAEFFLQAVYSRTFFEGGIVFAVLLLAIQIWLADVNTESNHSDREYLILGVGFGLIWSMGSNVGIRVLNMGVLIADIWALKILVTDMKNHGKYYRVMARASITVMFAVICLNRFVDVYRDNVVWQLNTKVNSGSFKGIYTTAHRAQEYETAVADIRQYTGEEDRLAVQEVNPWVYLESSARCGSYSVWYVDYTDERNDAYYRKYEKNMPTAIYLLNPKFGTYESWGWSSHGSDTVGKGSEQLERYLQGLVDSGNYEKIRGDSGCFYKLVKSL